MPEEIYFLYPAEYLVDFSLYSEIVFAMQQLGIENFLLYNQTNRCVESFTLLFDFMTFPRATPTGAMLPFTDGLLDTRIWENDNWSRGKESAIALLEQLTGKANGTLDDLKTAVRKQSYYPDCPVRTQASFDFDAARAVFAYVEPYINGTFMQEESEPGDPPLISYIRLINGFDTDERILINGKTEEVTYSDERYTAEDLQSVPDIGSLVEKLSYNLPAPPMMNTERLQQRGAQISGWYRKTEGKVYGIVKIEWVYVEDPISPTLQYRDAAYYLASSDGTYRSIEPDELREIIGDDYRVVEYKPNVPIPVPMP